MNLISAILNNRKVYRVWLLVLIFLCLLTACSQEETIEEGHFSLTLYWHSGPVDPAYAYAYQLKVGPEPAGELIYKPSQESLEWQVLFEISDEELRMLRQKVEALNLLKKRWGNGDPIDGGPSVSVSITAGRDHFTIPERSELNESDRYHLDQLVDALIAIIPQELWADFQGRILIDQESGSLQ